MTETIGLYEHNANSSKIIKEAYEKGQDVVGIVHATGTGKSYIALQLSYDNKDKKIVYVVPSNGIIEHIKNIIDTNPNLDIKRDFPNLEFRTYQSFISLSKEEISNIDCDLLILDEFHHLGAPVWGARINTMIETHPNMKIFGMTAYTVRERGTAYERDMANPDTDELFSRKIVSRYDLCDAMIDGVLPKPIYKSAYTNLIVLESKLEEKVQKLESSSKEYLEYMKILTDVKRRIHEAPSITNILRKSIKPNGKYIYFCPPISEEETNDIETIKKQALDWFKQFVKEEDIVFYTSTSAMGKIGKLNRDAFYDDATLEGEKVDNKLRVMFAINQYNEGIHAPNIDGVIMGRGTASDIVYFEQLGRGLSVRGNTKEMFDKLEKYSIEQLIQMCNSRDIPVKENNTKEELIEKLIAPVIIDLTNNYEFIKELENNLKDRIRDIQTNRLGNHREIKIKDASFDIEIENQDLFEMLTYVRDKLTMTWEDYYELAKAYYEHRGDLLIPQKFQTTDGYTKDQNGIKLGSWISNQRQNFDRLSEERKQKLLAIGFDLNPLDTKWENNYKLAKVYYEHKGDLSIPQSFQTTDGYTEDSNGVNLGRWINHQRTNFDKLSEEKKQKLLAIGFDLAPLDTKWKNNYKLAKAYYEHKGDLSIPQGFQTTDGYTKDPNGVNLGRWINHQRTIFNTLSEEKKQKLLTIGFDLKPHDTTWESNYKLAKAYYEHKGDLSIPKSFQTTDGYTEDSNGVNLGTWINTQRTRFATLSEEKKQKLLTIGFDLKPHDTTWESNYKLAQVYYEHKGNLLIPQSFKTTDGYTEDSNGVNLGQWINTQRTRFATLSDERKQKLHAIGFDLKPIDTMWENNYKLAKIYYEHKGDLLISRSFKTTDGYIENPNGVNLGRWITNQRTRFATLSDEKKQKLLAIGFVPNVTQNNDAIENICTQYNINIEKNKTVLKHISIQELQSKIEFLSTFNIPIVDENGLLIDIFFMSSPDTKEKYGISLEELINECYIKK